MNINADARYANADGNRAKHIEAVLSSKSRNRLVVAGPGTGKTYLFKRVLQPKKNNLTLTFINSLVEDLSLELSGISNVQTLHGFARGIIASATKEEIKVFSRMPTIVSDDAKILGLPPLEFDKLFHEMKIDGDNLQFYKNRKDYYSHYGFSDIIFAAVKFLEKEKGKIPTFDQIVVDEFQDFNLLEVSLIDLLAERSPLLLAGDDDQALYDFKSASADFIRARHAGAPGYESFNLPYCSRCTRVIVDATNDIVSSATKSGHLKGRIAKPYLYFDHKDKDEECSKYPTISYARLHAKQIPWFIEKSMASIAAEVKKSFGVLIISPANVHLREITTALRSKGFVNISMADKKDVNLELLDGLKLLLENRNCNLGWRIASKFLLSAEEFSGVLKKSSEDATVRFRNLVPADTRSRVRMLVTLLSWIRDERNITEADTDMVLKTVDLDARKIARETLRTDVLAGVSSAGNPAIRKLPIRTSTVQSSKGLAEEYVFITHFDDQYFLEKDKTVSDQSICKFLVALTRARKKVFLISSNPSIEPTFLKWISKERIELVAARP